MSTTLISIIFWITQIGIVFPTFTAVVKANTKENKEKPPTSPRLQRGLRRC